MTRFRGTKAALIVGSLVVVLRRDDRPGIPFPGRIDLPGGGRDGAETPLACIRRETCEETGLTVAEDAFHWARRYDGPEGGDWFFAAHLRPGDLAGMHLGNEGQALWLMEINLYLDARDAIPHQQARLREALGATR